MLPALMTVRALLLLLRGDARQALRGDARRCVAWRCEAMCCVAMRGDVLRGEVTRCGAMQRGYCCRCCCGCAEMLGLRVLTSSRCKC